MDTDRSTSSRRGDSRIIEIAKEVSQSRDRKAPAVLLQLKPILDSLPASTPEGSQIRREIWQYNLLKVLALVIRQDYSVIPGEWATAADLAMILSVATCGLTVDNNEQKNLDELLEKTTENMLLLTRRIHLEMTNDKESPQTDLMPDFKRIIEALVLLCSRYFQLCVKVINSPWLLQLLVSDIPKTVNIMMALIEKMLRLDPHVLSRVEEETVLTLMDELIFKLTVNTDVSIAAGAARCLLRLCDYHRQLVETLCTRYKGLRPLLRRWEGRGFERDLKHLGMLLDSGSALKAKSQRNHECAKLVQAVWRGYMTRRKLRRANKAFSKFQKSYRLKRAENEQAKLQTQYQNDLYHRMKLQRQRLLRSFHEKRLHILEILPASRIEEFLKKEKSVAAVRIQTLWRGHRERGRLFERKKVAQQVHAAITIQRVFRKWRERQAEANQEIPMHMKPTGLTDSRRVELNKVISQWRDEHPTTERSREELEALHLKTQELLGRHYYRMRPYRKLEYSVENVMARLDTDSQLVAFAPSLNEAGEKEIDMYSSRSLPIATVAKQQHNLQLKKLQMPWWKTLGWEEDVDETERERVEAEVLLETLGV